MTDHLLTRPIRSRWLLLAVILTGTSGCDNVRWGGVDLSLEGPADSTTAVPADPSEQPAEAALPELPTVPVLLAGDRSGETATLTVVGMVRGEALDPFPSENDAPGFRDHFARALLTPGTELVLFSEGVRVGRMTVSETSVDPSFCVERPTASGVVELVPGASGVESVVALLDPMAPARPFGPWEPLQHTYAQRVASLNIASGAIQRIGALRPPSLVQARIDVRSFRTLSSDAPSVAATFIFGDRPAVAPPDRANAYALFVVGSPEADVYAPDFVWYRPADTEGKGVPRYLDHLDWDGDGDSEILLEILGAEHRWFAGLAWQNGAWFKTFEDPCGRITG